MRTKFSWVVFACLPALVAAALTLPRLLRLGGDFRTFLYPIGVLGALLTGAAAGIKSGRWQKFFFILTGASALGWPVSLFLHDQLVKIWSTEPVTYVLVFYILPVTFVTGVLGTIITGLLGLFARSSKK
jgi:hypothetical protein